MKIAVIGGGAAGIMAAISAASSGASVVLYEKMRKLGKKLAITGKGRCNVTNNCSLNEIIENIPTNPRFMYGALASFTPQDVMAFFEDAGVPLKTERGNRVFPVSDKAFDIVNALEKKMEALGVAVFYRDITGIAVSEKDGEVFATGVCIDEKLFRYDRVILATGGLSYPATGSTGDGYKFAEALGIKVTDILPSLVPLEVCEHYVKSMQGLSLKNVALRAFDTEKNKLIYEDFGEMLFTHFGVSGPMILSMSAHLRNITPGRYKISIDLKPALDAKTLDRRLLSDFEKGQNKNFINILGDLLPSKMIPIFVTLTEISPDRKVNTVTKSERAKILSLLKNFEFTVKSARHISEAIITSGGIDVKEINAKTLESKKIRGLYFAGEVIDVDAYTGGFNLQIAWSTGHLAGVSAAMS